MIVRVKKIEELEYLNQNNKNDIFIIGDKYYNDIIKIVEDFNIDMQNKIRQAEQHIIFSLEDDEWNYIIKQYGELIKTDILFINNVDDIFSYLESNYYKYVTIFGRAHKMTPILLEKLQRFQLMYLGSSQETYFGVITARNIEMLSFIVGKLCLYRMVNEEQKVMVIDRLEFETNEIQNSENYTVLSYKNACIDKIDYTLNNSNYSHMTFVGHGRDDIVWMTEGSFCAKAKYFDEEYINNNKPCCEYTNKCFRNNMNVLPMWKLKTKNIFAASCFSLKTSESLFGLKYSLLYSALDGYATSYIGSPHIVDGCTFLNYLYIALVKSGYSLGEVAVLICKAYIDYGFGSEIGYFLVGDSSYRENKYVVPYDMDYPKNNNNTYMKCNIPECYLVIMDLACDNLVADFFSGKLRIIVSTSENQKIYGVLRYKNNRTYLYLFSNDILKSSETYVSIQYSQEFDFSKIEDIEHICAQYEKISQLIKEDFRAAKQMAINICEDKKEDLFILTNTKKLYSKYEKYIFKIDTINKTISILLNDLTNLKGFAFGEHCIAKGMQYQSYTREGVCNNCGRDLYVFNYIHPIYKGLKRIFYMCPICGYIKDFSNKNCLNIYFIGESEYKINKEIIQEVYIKNNSTKYINGYGGVRFVSGIDMNTQYTDELIKVNIAPFEEKVYTTRINYDLETNPHSYWLKGTFVLNEEIIIIKKDLWLRK